MTEKERHVDACNVESNGICANTSRLVPPRGRKSVAATTVPPPELVKSRNICIIRSACSRAHSFQNKRHRYKREPVCSYCLLSMFSPFIRSVFLSTVNRSLLLARFFRTHTPPRINNSPYEFTRSG